MDGDKHSFTEHAHLVILAVTLAVSILGWQQHLPTANRTYSLTWADYSPMNSSNLIIEAGKAPASAPTTLSWLENSYGG